MYRSQTTDLFSDGRNKNITTTWRASVALRDRRQQLQVRLHRQPARRHPLGQPRRERPALPRQQRRAEPADAVRPQPAERSVDAQRRLLRAGAVDARPADAAGRAALRPRVELGAGAAARSRGSGPRRSCSTRRRSWTATTTSRRARRSPTISSATARRRSRRRSASISSPPSRRRTTASATRRRASPPTSPGPGPTATATGTLTATCSNPQRAGLRPDRRLLRRHQQPQLRHLDLQQHHRPGHPARAGACGRRTGTGACRCSTRCCRARRSRSASSIASSSASP